MLIIKKGAISYVPIVYASGDSPFEVYNKYDTINISPDWRPENWEEVKLGFCNTMGCVSVGCSQNCRKLEYLEVVRMKFLKALEEL